MYDGRELLQSTSRWLILIASGVCLIWQVLFIESHPQALLLNYPVTLSIILASMFALWLLPKRPLIAQAVWQIGLAASITTAAYVFQESAFVFFYALLPLIAAVNVGWLAGLLSEVVIIGLI